MTRPPPTSPLPPPRRSPVLVPAPADPEQEAPVRHEVHARHLLGGRDRVPLDDQADPRAEPDLGGDRRGVGQDRKSTRLNSSHGYISYAVFCLKKKKNTDTTC